MSEKQEHHCNENCHHCSGHCNHNVRTCPVCHRGAIKVPTETVKTLTQMDDIGDDFYLCTHPKCPTVYFNHDFIFNKCDITTKVWYKGSLEEFIVCYCHKIMLKDVIEAVFALKGCTDKNEILKYLGKSLDEKDCLHKNPTGKDCDKLFENAIEYAKEQYVLDQKED